MSNTLELIILINLRVLMGFIGRYPAGTAGQPVRNIKNSHFNTIKIDTNNISRAIRERF